MAENGTMLLYVKSPKLIEKDLAEEAMEVTAYCFCYPTSFSEPEIQNENNYETLYVLLLYCYTYSNQIR